MLIIRSSICDILLITRTSCWGDEEKGLLLTLLDGQCKQCFEVLGLGITAAGLPPSDRFRETPKNSADPACVSAMAVRRVSMAWPKA